MLGGVGRKTLKPSLRSNHAKSGPQRSGNSTTLSHSFKYIVLRLLPPPPLPIPDIAATITSSTSICNLFFIKMFPYFLVFEGHSESSFGSPEILSNNLKEALQNLNSALKSQPQLILGSRNSQATNTPVQAVQHHDQKLEEDTRTSLPGIKNTGSSSGLGCRSREHSRELTKKVLRTQLSKVAIVSLEFSEALPFAAFTSFLVDEVEDLGRMAQFSEYEDDGNDHKIVVTCENQSS